MYIKVFVTVKKILFLFLKQDLQHGVLVQRHLSFSAVKCLVVDP